MARDQDQVTLGFDLSRLLADKEAAYEFLREYTGLEIADNIRRLREDRELTQVQLAETLNTTQSVVARLEDEGYRRYSLTTLQKIAEAFDVWPTVVFEPFRGVIHRVVVNARPMIQTTVGSVTWADFETSTWPQQWAIHANVGTPMIDPGVGTLASQIWNPRMVFSVADNDGLNFEVGFIDAEGTFVNVVLPDSPSGLETTIEHKAAA